MKIIHVTPRYFPNIGGVETLVKELCESLSAKGFNVVVYSLDYNPQIKRKESINGVLVRRYHPLIGDPLFLPPWSFLRDLRREGPAIVHVHNIQTIFPLFVSLIKTVDQFLVMQPHYHRHGQTLLRDLFLSIYKLIIPKLIVNRAQVIIVNSNYEKKIFKEDFSSKKTCLTVPEGLPMQELRTTKWQPEIPDRILYVGALKKYKRVDIILKAFKILLNHKPTSTKLIIVGDGPDKQRLLKLSSELELSKFIEWKRNLSRYQLLVEYSKAKVFVLLSVLESFSRVVNEAVVIGVPTVVPRGDVFSELINCGVVEGAFSEKPESVANAILHAKQKSSNLAKSNCISFYDSYEYANRIAAIYLSLVSKSVL